MTDLELRPWTAEDIELLRALNAPAMTEHLGGPESDEQLAGRLTRYVNAQTDAARMFKVLVGGVAAGSVGYWERDWNGGKVYETGWGVVPEFQGRGVATGAMQLVIGFARAARRHGEMHAFPSLDNGPSNAICRKLGFDLLGECEFEYPKGRWTTGNDWRLSLR